MTNDTVVHEHPAWREQANFIIVAEISTSSEKIHWRWEQLWARQIDKTRFVLCCIPFFVYDLALGDEVETGPCDEKQYVVKQVVKPSGHYTFRVWFSNPDARNEVSNKLTHLGCQMEWRWSSGNLLAVDAASNKQAQAVADFLWEKEQQGLLVYETGQTEQASPVGSISL